MSRDVFEDLLKGCTILGALGGAALGFTQGGVGGAIVGLAVGGIAGYVAVALIWVVVVEMMPLWFWLGVVATIIWVISALWGVGKP